MSNLYFVGFTDSEDSHSGFEW